MYIYGLTYLFQENGKEYQGKAILKSDKYWSKLRVHIEFKNLNPSYYSIDLMGIIQI